MARAARQKPQQPTAEAAANPKATARDVAVMIVDDHPLTRGGLKQAIDFEDNMKVIAEAGSAREAFQLLKTHRPDVIVMDLTLEDVSGLEVIKMVKDQYGDIPVLTLSMHDEGLYAERALRAGARGYLMKRESADKLITAIRTVVKGDVYVSEPMSAKMLGRFVGGNPRSVASPLEQLSDRELEVFELVGQGHGVREIAEKLFVSVKTVESHREHIKLKLKLENATELVQHATQWVLYEGSPKRDPR